ncbi:MAG: hypothetical protein U0842_23650 [Candidatus Binatia bacterium]
MMRGLPTRLLALLAGLLALASAQPSAALIDDPFTAKTQPANTLVMPFDATEGRTTFLLASNLAGKSGTVAAVTTHWSFWSESCTHLLDVPICLTLNDTIVVDPTNVSPTNAANQAVGPNADLTGNRGYVTVTAYATDANCADASVLGYQLVDDALVGTMTLADTTTGKAFGIDAVGLGVDGSGSFVELPDLVLSPSGNDGFLTIQTFNPESIDSSIVILVSLKEKTGTLPGEIGPIGVPVTASVSFFDNIETRTSLPDASIACALYTSTVPADTGSLVPGTVTLTSSGFVQLTNIYAGSAPVGDADGNDGNDTWVYGFHGQAVDKYGGSSSAKYQVLGDVVIPTPGPTRTPKPTAIPTPVSTATFAPTITPRPTTTAAPTATPKPTTTAAPTATPKPTTTAAATPTPTPAPTATAAPTATPTPAGITCAQADVTIAVNYTSGDFPDVAGMTVGLKYPASVNIPGFGNEQTVKDRVSNLTGVTGGLFNVGDQDADSLLNIGLISIGSTIPSGNFARVRFDCASGATLPAAGAFTCTVDASTGDGNPVTPTQCVLTVAKVS